MRHVGRCPLCEQFAPSLPTVLFLLGKRSLKVWAASQTLLAGYSCRAAISTPPLSSNVVLVGNGSVRLRKHLAETLAVAWCLARLRTDPDLHPGLKIIGGLRWKQPLRVH